MALRSLLRKMPALGLRSTPMGPRMGLVDTLLPAAGSRFMSHGRPGGQIIYSEDEKLLARQKEKIKTMRAEFQQNHEKLNYDMNAFADLMRRDSEEFKRLNKKLETDKGCHIIYSEEVLAEQQEKIKQMRTEIKQFHEKLSKDINDFSARVRRDSANDAARFNQKLDMVEKTCNVLILVGVPAFLFMIV